MAGLIDQPPCSLVDASTGSGCGNCPATRIGRKARPPSTWSSTGACSSRSRCRSRRVRGRRHGAPHTTVHVGDDVVFDGPVSRSRRTPIRTTVVGRGVAVDPGAHQVRHLRASHRQRGRRRPSSRRGRVARRARPSAAQRPSTATCRRWPSCRTARSSPSSSSRTRRWRRTACTADGWNGSGGGGRVSSHLRWGCGRAARSSRSSWPWAVLPERLGTLEKKQLELVERAFRLASRAPAGSKDGDPPGGRMQQQQAGLRGDRAQGHGRAPRPVPREHARRGPHRAASRPRRCSGTAPARRGSADAPRPLRALRHQRGGGDVGGGGAGGLRARGTGGDRPRGRVRRGVRHHRRARAKTVALVRDDTRQRDPGRGPHVGLRTRVDHFAERLDALVATMAVSA